MSLDNGSKELPSVSRIVGPQSGWVWDLYGKYTLAFKLPKYVYIYICT